METSEKGPMETYLERYRPIVSDWNQFIAALRRDLPTIIWVNPIRTNKKELSRKFIDSGLKLTQVPWELELLRLDNCRKPGRLAPYVNGSYHVQEEVSAIPVLALDPQPGERILDLCAAPGNKTAQIAVRMKNTGTVLANDMEYSRLRPLKRSMERLGLLNVSTSSLDGRIFPRLENFFDRVLADVPCSCEGTIRKNIEIWNENPEVRFRRDLPEMQYQLLKKAATLCKPGGRIVYSTCTFAPEENEMVLQRLVDEHGVHLEIEPFELEGFQFNPGLKEWQGKKFNPSIENARRVWPEKNDTGGFFIAKIRKISSFRSEPPDLSESFKAMDWEPDGLWAEELREQFGIANEDLSGIGFFKSNKRFISAVSKDHVRLLRPSLLSSGMFAYRANQKVPKITSAFAMLVGAHAKKNFIELNEEQLSIFISRKDQELELSAFENCDRTGYVIVRFNGEAFGVGEIPRLSRQSLTSHFPKAWAMQRIDFRI